MKIFLLFLLTILVPTATPHVLSKLDKCKDQYILLGEIIEHVNGLKGKQYSQIYVDNVITSEHCAYENFCKAGIVLSKYKAEELGLEDKDWLLPRALVAYTRKTICDVKAVTEKVELHQLLHNIKQCAQTEYKNPCV
ncbi:hypothetical protein KOW79_012463 [Hemibagrus wyckioides]|uniref:Uncharacterized protein n=1 Tax=Hemibagrus wyckioides TaxID=337641 RepID=A0A9D3NLK4_9TELE|nr:hypothetical protein KOW79_012463 [Hemibagrus wyckioides]